MSKSKDPYRRDKRPRMSVDPYGGADDPYGRKRFRARIEALPIPPGLWEAIRADHARLGPFPSMPQPPQVSGEDRRKYVVSCVMALALNDRIQASEMLDLARALDRFLLGD